MEKVKEIPYGVADFFRSHHMTNKEFEDIKSPRLDEKV